MVKDLISKKELLKKAGITYGQLYRWKRRGLIPEEWFIKKSCATGQETYLPRTEILKRVEKIKNLKKRYSLDEIAQRFSNKFREISLDANLLVQYNIVTLRTLNYLFEHFGPVFALNIENVLYGYMLEKLVEKNEINYEEERELLLILKDIFTTEFGKNYDIIIWRKLGVVSCFAVTTNSEMFFDRNTRIIARMNIVSFKEELLLKLSEANISLK